MAHIVVKKTGRSERFVLAEVGRFYDGDVAHLTGVLCKMQSRGRPGGAANTLIALLPAMCAEDVHALKYTCMGLMKVLAANDPRVLAAQRVLVAAKSWEGGYGGYDYDIP